MKIVSFIAFTGLLLHECPNICTAQPVATDTAIHVSTIMQVRPTAVRIAVNPIDHALYYATFQGGLYKIRNQGSVYSDTLIATATQHQINYLQSIAFKDSNIYLVGNRKAPNTAGHGLVMRGKFKPNGTWQWDTLMYTVNYPSTATLFDHAFSSICVSANGDSLYIGSGSRTDHGEVQTSNGLFPNTREVGLTSTVFRIPINPAAPVYLPNDSAILASGPYVYCRGVRNSFDMALAPNGDLLASENSGDRDDPEELNWLRNGGHYGFPWRMGGNLTGMQFSNYNQSNDLLINHNCLAWTNGYFYNDLNYPQPPGLVTFSEPVKNYGPDGDKFRNANTGLVHDASDEGTFITSFTPHRSPLGLVFDINGKLTAPYNYGAFIMSYTEGTADTSGTLPNGSTGPFSDVGQDLLQLALFKDTASGQYSMNCYRIAGDFKNPVDACLDDNVLYVIESHYPGNPLTPKLYALTFPLNTNNGNSAFLPKDSVICSGNSITIAPNIKGKWNYQWSNGATTAQIAVSPTANTTYWLTINNGITMSTDTIVISVSKPPTIPSTITITGGIAKVCPGSTRTYTVSFTAGVTYNWVVPAGATINSGQGTSSINLTYTSGFTANDTLTVIKMNSCGSSPERNLIIQRNLPSTPGAITGNTIGLCILQIII